jgi:hypothetical protein
MGDLNKNNFIAKHWRGDYSLPFSYWVISFCTNITTSAVSALVVSYLQAQQSFNPFVLAFGNLLLLLILMGITIWHFFGTWRSATFYSLKPENQKRYWGGIAKAILILGAIKSAGFIIPYCNSVIVLMEIAFGNDPNIPDYKITITESGTELKIEGGIKYGLIRDVETLLKSTPDVRTVNLESVGGRIGVGDDLYELIVRYKLNTVTNDLCVSACAIAFAGGRERWLGIGARIGFHAGKFETMSESETREQKLPINNKISFKNGTSKAFLNKGDTTPNKDMRYPTRDELFSEKYITSIAPKAHSSIRLIEKRLDEVALTVKKTIPNKLNDNITLSDVKVDKTKFVYFYDITQNLHEWFKLSKNQADQIKLVTTSVCKSDSMQNDIRLGIIYAYHYRDTKSQAQSFYFEVGHCPV